MVVDVDIADVIMTYVVINEFTKVRLVFNDRANGKIGIARTFCARWGAKVYGRFWRVS